MLGRSDPSRNATTRRSLRFAWGFALLASAFALGGSPKEKVSPAPRRHELEAVRAIVRDRFFDPALRGLDWEAIGERYAIRVREAEDDVQAAAAIDAMLDELGTSHTRYLTPDEPAYYVLGDLFRDVPVGETIAERFPDGEVAYTGIGLFTQEVDGDVFVRGVVDGGPAERAGLLVGDRIVSVAGGPWHPIRPFVGRAGQAVAIAIQRNPDPSSVVKLPVVPRRIVPGAFFLAAMEASARLIERGGRTIAYVHVWSYGGIQYQQLLERLLADRLAQADALVLDLRDGWGGADTRYLNLFNRRVPVMTRIDREGESSDYDPQWRKPVALLVNGGTRSGKELIAFGFRRYGYGPVVGTRTAGAVMAGRCFAIGDRGLLYLAVHDIRVDGERLEGRGVAPDVEVPFPIPYAAGTDPQLDAALELLREG